MAKSMLRAVALGVLILLASDGRSQEQSVATLNPQPLQILDECVRAIQQQEFTRYVDHLAPTEQKLQAGYALFLSASILPQVDASSDQIDPELLLLMRAVGDLIKEHVNEEFVANTKSFSAADAAAQMFVNQLIAPVMVSSDTGYSTPKAMNMPLSRDMFVKSAEKALNDPRLFLIATLTEFSRPVQLTGDPPAKDSELPDLGELAKMYEQQPWTLYTRGDYALAVPEQRESDSQNSVPVAPAPWPRRIEFQRIDGVWKISQVLPISVFMSSTGRTAALCSGPECNIIGQNTLTPSAIPSRLEPQAIDPLHYPDQPIHSPNPVHAYSER